MNKGRREELTQLKFRKRLKNYRLSWEDKDKFHAFKTSGKPCSCYMCRGLKYRDVDRQKNKLIEIE